MKQRVNRLPGIGLRAKSTRVLGLVGMMSLFACEGSGTGPTQEKVETVRPTLSTHKVQVTEEQAKQLQQQGVNVQLLADYGAFKVMQVSDKDLAALPEGAQTRDDFNDILLNAGVIDTASAHGRSLRGMKLQAAGKSLHIVQFSGPIKEEWVKELEATGVKIVTYIPNNAYIVYGDVPSMSRLQRHVDSAAAIQWNGDYLDDYKLNPAINTLQTKTYSIQLIKDEEANSPTLELIRSRQSRDGVIQEAQGYVNVVAYLTVKDLYEIAARPDVLSIMPRPTPHKMDERQDMIISGNLTGNVPSGPGYLDWLASKGFTQAQFTASGFGVDVSDSGMDNGTQAPNHFGLYVSGDISNTSRVVYNRLEGSPNSGSTIQGCDGHGTLNTHIVAGYSNKTGAPFTDETGFTHGLGVAPFVKVGSSVVFDPGTFTDPDYEDLQSRAYRDGSRISTNSWGASSNLYDADAQRYDALVRDAQPTGSAVPNTGNQEMVIVFAAGNDGSSANTVGTPGTAKNIITVGASENVRAFGGADFCDIDDTDANSANDIIFFSSRGPTSDGRKKPDIVAPGTHVSGGVAQAAGQRANPPANPNGEALSCFDASGVCGGPGVDFYPDGQEWYTASSGTSHSTPAVAGGAALVRQYFINQGINPPSAAMTKGYLMNSAHYMTGSGANDTLYSNTQGMGLMDLGMAFDGTQRLLDDENPANLLTATGQTRTFDGVIADSSKPFRVTLAWTDAPGSTSGSAWKNNLDLSVTIGTNTYKGNVFTGGNSTTGGTADSSNNVESVFLPAGTEGSFTITVTASNINSDGVPGNASSLDQDFALIAYNTCTTAAPTPSGVTAAVNGDNRIDVSWTENGAPSYNIYRATTAGGPYVRVGSAAASPYADIGVSGGTTYYYVVRAVQCAESPKSNEATVTATGACTLPPTFAGITAATNGLASTCSNTVTWAAGTPICGGTLSYSVYRGTTSGFTPSVANKIATGLTGTSFNDDLNLTNGSKYYYVVRATEVSNATNEDTNTVEKSAVPTGALSGGVNYFDDLDANRPTNAAAYWIASGTTLNITTNCHYQSSNKSYRWGAANANCGGTYPASNSATLSLGGNGTTAGINGFAIPASSLSPQMSFNLWYTIETDYDGAWLVYSTTSASGPWTEVFDTPSTTAPYISAGGYDSTLDDNASVATWTGTNAGTNGSLKAVTVNLQALAGQTVWFGFKFSSDSIVNKEGAYLDDVRITANAYDTCATSVPPPGPAVGYKITNLPATTGAGDAVTFDVTALDAVGQTATGYTGSASFTSTDAQAQLPSPATFAAGVATGIPVSFRTLGTQSITASDTTDPAVQGSGSTSVTAGAPVALKFTAQPSNTAAGSSISPSVKVGMVDQFGNAVSTGNNDITVALDTNAGGGTLSGTTTVAASNGVATFGNLALDKVGDGYTLAASSAGLTGTTSTAFNITSAAPAKLAILTQPSTAQAGSAITPAVKVIVLDRFDNPATSTAQVAISIKNNAGNGTLSGTASVAAVSGVATFADLSINKVGTGYTLEVSSSSLTSVETEPFDITPADPYRVIITGQPSDATAGAAISPAITATVLDQFGNVATQATDPVVASLGNNPTGAKLRGTTSVNPVSGVATFSDLSVSKAGQNYSLVVGSRKTYSDTSVGFDIGAHDNNSSDKLVFKSAPDHYAAGEALSFEVELQNAEGTVIDSSQSVTLSFGNNPAGGQLIGTTTVAAVNGVAKFTGVSVQKVGSGYALVASAEGFDSATSAAFAVNPGPAASFDVSLPASVTADEEISISATALDTYGNVAASYGGSVKVTSSDESATFNGTANFVEGKLSNFKVTFKSGGLKSLTLTDASNASLTSSSQTNVTTVPVVTPPAEDDGCGCGATSGTDASIYLGLIVLARYALGRRRKSA